MCVCTTGSALLSLCTVRGGRTTETHPHTRWTQHNKKMEWSMTLKSYNQTYLLTSKWSRLNFCALQQKIKKKSKKKNSKPQHLVYPTSSSIATLIFQQDQYIFYIILRYLLYFSDYLQLYKQSTHFKVHIFNTVLTILHLQDLYFPQNKLKIRTGNKEQGQSN